MILYIYINFIVSIPARSPSPVFGLYFEQQIVSVLIKHFWLDWTFDLPCFRQKAVAEVFLLCVEFNPGNIYEIDCPCLGTFWLQVRAVKVANKTPRWTNIGACVVWLSVICITYCFPFLLVVFRLSG